MQHTPKIREIKAQILNYMEYIRLKYNVLLGIAVQDKGEDEGLTSAKVDINKYEQVFKCSNKDAGIITKLAF